MMKKLQFKHLLSLAAVILFLAGGGDLRGETTITIGAETNTGDYFIRTNYKYALCESIFTATELNNALKNEGYATPAVGCIFNKVAYKAKTEVTREIEIYITTTTKSQFSNSADVVPVSSLDKVFSGSVTFEADAWTTITLNNQYEWDGESNLLILVNDKTGATTSPAINFYYSSVSNSTNYNYRNTNSFNPTGLPTGNRTSNRSNIQITVGSTDKPRPTALSTSAIGTTTATIGWASTSEDIINYTYQYKLASNDWESIEGEGTVNTLTTSLSSLTAGTIYDFRVKANYSGGSSNWIEKNFITASNVTDNNKFNYGFEDVTRFEFWTISLPTTQSDIVNTNANSGSNCFLFKNNSTSQVIISPLLHTSSNGVHVKLYWKSSGINYKTKLNIGYSTTNTESFTYPQYVTTNKNTYQCSEFDLTYSDIKYIAIQFDRNGSQNGDVYIDDIELSECQVSCSVPEHFALSSISNNSASFSWDAVDGEIDGYEVYVSDNSTIPTEETSGSFTATNSYTKSSLEENTQYYAWVRTKCEEDSYSSWSSTVDFTTDCGVKNLPYTYGFEDAAEFNCWTMNNCYSTTNITQYSTHAGSYKFAFNYSVSYDLQTIITPELNATASGIRVEFYFRGSSSESPKLKIAYSTTDNDIGSFDWDHCAEASVNSSNSSSYAYFGCDFPVSNIKYIAIQYDRNSTSSNIYLDDIKFSEMPTTDLPYEYGFETDSELNNWIKRDCYSSTGIKNTGHDSSHSFGFIYISYMATQYLITPKLNGTTNGALIGFYFTAGANCKFQIGYSSTNDATGSFTFGEEVTETTASYKYYKYYCPANTKYICIKYVGSSSTNCTLNIDDIRIVTFDKVSNGSQGYAYWNNDSDWYPVNVPSSTDNVYINHDMTIPDDCTAEVNSITFGPSGSLTIENGGELILSNSNTDVEATVKKTVTASSSSKTATNNWYAISSPTHDDGQYYESFSNVSNLTPEEPDLYNVYRYDEYSVVWQEHRDNNNKFNTMKKGRGYLFRSTKGGDLEYSGVVNTDTVKYNLSWSCPTEKFKGFNLIGNPYTHTIYKGAEGSAIPNGGILEEKYYTIGTNGRLTLTADGTAIAPGQAIFVQAKEASTLTMNNSTSGEVTGKYANDNIWFMVKNAESSDLACVEFRKGHGLNKVEHRNDITPMLYIMHNGENFASADMSDNTSVINLGFEAKTTGEYTFSLKATGTYSYMHLIDKITGANVDMLIEDNYSFVGSPRDRKDRFVLRLNYNAANIDSESDIFAYQNGADIIVRGEGELQVFDVTGRMAMKRQINGVQTVNGLNNGVYIFRLVGTEVKTQKIVVR